MVSYFLAQVKDFFASKCLAIEASPLKASLASRGPLLALDRPMGVMLLKVNYS